MSSTVTGLRAGVRGSGEPIGHRLRVYFASDRYRTLQTVLGAVWLLDGILQFQSFMYSRGFVQMITAMTAGQPSWLHDSIMWAINLAGRDLTVWNTAFAVTQVTIGLTLLYRPTAKLGLVLSFLWVPIVWWFGEAFGMMFMSMAAPLTGAPGAVVLYLLIGLMAWPTGRPAGLLTVSAAKRMWAVLWIVMAYLWLLAPSSEPNAVHDAITAAPSGMSWLSSLQLWVAGLTRGHGLVIALVMCAVTAAIGIAVALDWRPRLFLGVGIGLNLAYWILGQGLGGILQGRATDPNAGPLFVVLAAAMYPLIGLSSGAVDHETAPRAAAHQNPATPPLASAHQNPAT